MNWLNDPGYCHARAIRVTREELSTCLARAKSAKGWNRTLGYARLSAKALYAVAKGTRLDWVDEYVEVLVNKVVMEFIIHSDLDKFELILCEYTNHRKSTRYWHQDGDEDILNIIVPLVRMGEHRGTIMYDNVELYADIGEAYAFNGRFEHTIAPSTKVSERHLIRIVLRRKGGVYVAQYGSRKTPVSLTPSIPLIIEPSQALTHLISTDLL
jgi:hypothetical protein